jgi:hypothetical protein
MDSLELEANDEVAERLLKLARVMPRQITYVIGVPSSIAHSPRLPTSSGRLTSSYHSPLAASPMHTLY